MVRVFLIFIVIASIWVLSEGQLTFSSGWGQGKRSIRTDIGDGCTTEEALYAIYKLVENEAEKLVSCQTEGKN
ncbi:hypothetical protein K1T71_012021 [Dendrolimus kikuchii]|uniref:Uncharacterized protein n=1 Tax=Dendrolimus kikuchii TaxID=765133 RepID=A0ACC1CKH6_9NEOP|nr:hypothetical protein K1T71_012021 [Dendrolimus kikuchii]